MAANIVFLLNLNFFLKHLFSNLEISEFVMNPGIELSTSQFILYSTVSGEESGNYN